MTNDPRQGDLRTAALVMIASIALVAALYVGREFLVPIALAGVLSILFRPVVRWMERARIPTTLAAAIIVLTLIAAFVVAGYALAAPMKNWIARAPENFAVAEKKLSRY